jgi:hypothetical protein
MHVKVLAPGARRRLRRTRALLPAPLMRKQADRLQNFDPAEFLQPGHLYREP